MFQGLVRRLVEESMTNCSRMSSRPFALLEGKSLSARSRHMERSPKEIGHAGCPLCQASDTETRIGALGLASDTAADEGGCAEELSAMQASVPSDGLFMGKSIAAHQQPKKRSTPSDPVQKRNRGPERHRLASILGRRSI